MAGIPRFKGLRARHFGGRDLVMYGFAQTLAGAMTCPGNGSAMFCEYVALAFFAHVVRVYASLLIRPFARGGLAPWQLRRAYEFIDANLAGDLSISHVAARCGLSSSYFSRVFKCATGLPTSPMADGERRVEHAKELLDEPKSPSSREIAQMCGFVDQKLYWRAFLQKVKVVVRGAGAAYGMLSLTILPLLPSSLSEPDGPSPYKRQIENVHHRVSGDVRQQAAPLQSICGKAT